MLSGASRTSFGARSRQSGSSTGDSCRSPHKRRPATASRPTTSGALAQAGRARGLSRRTGGHRPVFFERAMDRGSFSDHYFQIEEVAMETVSKAELHRWRAFAVLVVSF